MKSKYRTYFKTKRHPKYNIEIRANKENYIFMYCKKSIKDFDKKAKRIYSYKLFDLLKRAKNAVKIGGKNGLQQ